MRVLCGTSQFTILMCTVQLSVVSLLVAPQSGCPDMFRGELRVRRERSVFGAVRAVRRSGLVRADFFYSFAFWTFYGYI